MAVLLVILFIALFIIWRLATQLRNAPTGSNAGGIQAKPILTDNEKEFFYRLQRALPNLHVFPQVAANAMLKVASNVPREQTYATRNQFAQKHVDFVVCERDSLNVIAIVELDDKLHIAEKDRIRDAMFEQGGYKVLRFQSRRKPSEAEIGDVIGYLRTFPPFDLVQQAPVFERAGIPQKQETTW